MTHQLGRRIFFIYVFQAAYIKWMKEIYGKEVTGMNGELHDLCAHTLYANLALQEITAFAPLPENYILDRKYIFSESFGFCTSAEKWFEISVKRGMHAVQLIVPVKSENRSHLGFVNQTRAYLVLFRKNRGPSVLVPFWSFDAKKKGWHVMYRESEWVDKPVSVPMFEDESEELIAVLNEIEALAEDIHETYFAGCFRSAREILEGKKMPEYEPFPDLPEPYGRILAAVSRADLFGAMGSWNDCPPGEAREIGRENDYNRLSDALLKGIRSNLMYAVNSCYREV